MVDTAAVKSYFMALQALIVERMEQVDGGYFVWDTWQRPEGGGGVSCVLEDSHILERAGVNFSHVMGDRLPPSASQSHPDAAGRPFEAMGVSLVFHPRNPHAPTVHMNVRCFVAGAGEENPVWWFGGGMDLTPYYGYVEDAVHFHQICYNALAPFDLAYYPRFKQWCDDYFLLRHRNEPRGVGGIFLDDFNAQDFDHSFQVIQSVGDHFLSAYIPILQRRMHMPYTEQQREFQAYRRGRYVEFNLVYDRGTLFGLQSRGRTESILMSMPPLVRWRYDWQAEPGTPEAQLLSDFLVGKDWLMHNN